MADEIKSIPHPDNFMVLDIGLKFRGKLGPNIEDAPALEISHRRVLAASRAEQFLERVLSAVRERRLYGLAAQAIAESSVGAGEWVAVEITDLMADMQTYSSEHES